MLYDYEMAMILSAKLTEEKQKKVLDEVKKYITAQGGKAEDAKLFGKKIFAYPVKGETEGFYYIFKYALEGKETAQFSNKLKMNEGVLRYLVIRK